jgi:protein-S-isoprenylcysteine O-methyltransferase Ste14
MSIKGFDQIRRHIPALNTPLGVLGIFILPVAAFLLATAIFNALARSGPVWELVGEVLLGSLGFSLMYLFVRYKSQFRARFGPLAYSQAARWLGWPGVAIIAAVVTHIRTIPGPAIPHGWWTIAVPVLGWALIVIGLLLFLRVVQVFGVDNLIMLYVYFPEESRLVNHRIYGILRHPAYAAAQRLAFGLALLNGNWFALACALLFAFGLWGWVHWVEEKELIERFGPSYGEYRRRTPAFWPHLNDLQGFYKFLILGR